MDIFYTFQDFEKHKSDIPRFMRMAINAHVSSEDVKIAKDADNYAAQRNTTINEFVPIYYNMLGQKKVDFTKSNHHIACNFFDYLNSQRTNYSLGNGVTFDDEKTLEKLGKDFSTTLSQAGYYGLIHKVSFLFYNGEKCFNFKLTEFVPFYDEETSALRAGIRFWQLAHNKPQMAVLYEEDGYTVYKAESNSADFAISKPKRAYRQTVRKTPIDETPEIIGEDNWGVLPIFPIYGSRLKQSTLVGMKGGIDAFDLGKSGFANTMDQCNDLLTVISNANGMDEYDLIKLRDVMKTLGIISADEGSIHTVNRTVDHAARTAFLNEIRQGIFEDFGGLDVHTIMSGATNDHISAAYEPLNAKADDFEDQITKGLRPLLEMLEIDDSPTFKRRAIANDSQYNAMILQSANYLDDQTILQKLTFIDNDEVEVILQRKDEQDMNRFLQNQQAMIAAAQMSRTDGGEGENGSGMNPQTAPTEPIVEEEEEE